MAFSVDDVNTDEEVVDGESVTITCTEAGTLEGTVTVGGVEQTVATWSDTTITITALDATGLALGPHTLEVTQGAADYGTGWATTWRTTTPDEVITFEFANGTYTGAVIEWGDGTPDYEFPSGYSSHSVQHTFATPGDHLVKCAGPLPNWRLSSMTTADKAKLIHVHQYGTCSSIYMLCSGAPNLKTWAVGSPCDATVGSMSGALASNPALETIDFTGFTTTPITYYIAMISCTGLTAAPDLSVLDMSGTTIVTSMCRGWTSIPQCDTKIDQWDISGIGEYTSFMLSSSLSTAAYDRVCVSWGQNQTMANTTDVHMGNSKYSNATAHAAFEAQVTRSPGNKVLIDGGAA